VIEVPGDNQFDALPALRGRAWVFGDDVAAVMVVPRDQWERSVHESATVVMAGIDPTFARAIDRGDFIVAGLNFACGATHPLIGSALQQAGVGAVIARSFGPAFFDTAIAAGLPALMIEETGAIKSGDRLRVDVETKRIVNLSSGDRYIVRNLTDIHIDILRAGGLTDYQRRRM